MKKKIFLISSLIIALILLNTVVFAMISNSDEEKSTVLTGDKLSGVEEAYVEVDPTKNFMKASLSQKATIDEANSILADLNVLGDTNLQEDVTVKYFNNAKEGRMEKVVSDAETILKVDADTGEFLSYINNKLDFEKSVDSEDVVKDKAISIFQQLDIDEKDRYEFCYIEQFDEEIWRASFAKKYGDYINRGESVNFSFAPETNEIVTMSINRNTFENNEILISQEDAQRIAEKYLEKSVGTELEIALDIVKPNYFLRNVEGDDSIYKDICITRMAYVATFNNDAKTEIYIDATTGELIGGNIELGGAF